MKKGLLILCTLCAFVSVGIVFAQYPPPPMPTMPSNHTVPTTPPKPTVPTTPPKPTVPTTPPKPTVPTTPPKPTVPTTPPKPTVPTTPPKPTVPTTPPKPTVPTTPPKPTVPTTPPKPTVPTTPPKTTVPPTTTTTTLAPPNTTTTTLPTTTHKTTVPTTTPTTTLPTTTPTTTLPPTPRPEPTPGANLTEGDYALPSSKTGYCLKAHAALQIKVSTDKTNGTFIVQPTLSKAEGSCGQATSNLTIAFKEGFITLLFIKNDTEKNVYVNDVSFKLTYPFKSGDSETYAARNRSVRLFPAAIGHSYSCSDASLDLGGGLSLDMTHLKMQGLDLVNNQDYGMPDPCPADRPDYRVAIAVGVVLLVLIVVVVVAYLLGRRKRTHGYQTL